MDLEIRNYQKLLEEALNETRPLPGSPVPGGETGEAPEPVQEVLEASAKGVLHPTDEIDNLEISARPVYLRVWDHPMSPGTRHRLMEKARRLERKCGARGPKHHNTRRKKRREEYLRWEREGKLRRDRWLTSCPEGLFLYYKRLAKRKGAAWEFTKEQFVELMNTPVRGVPLYQYIFNLVRLDKKLGYSSTNIVVLDRYTKEVLYSTSN